MKAFTDLVETSLMEDFLYSIFPVITNKINKRNPREPRLPKRTNLYTINSS